MSSAMRRCGGVRSMGTGVMGVMAVMGALALGACTTARLSAAGDSCTRTADCEAPGRCHDRVCVSREGTDAKPFRTVDALARAIVAAIASGDPARLQALLMTEDEARRAAAACGEEVETVLARRQRHVVASFDARWARIQRDLAKGRIDATTLRLIETRPPRMVDAGSLKRLDGDFAFKVGDGTGRVFEMEAEELIVLDGQWILSDAEVEFENIRSGEPAEKVAPTGGDAGP